MNSFYQLERAIAMLSGLTDSDLAELANGDISALLDRTIRQQEVLSLARKKLMEASSKAGLKNRICFSDVVASQTELDWPANLIAAVRGGPRFINPMDLPSDIRPSVNYVLSQLKKAQRDAILLFFRDGKDLKSIASGAGVTEKELSVAIAQGIRQMQNWSLYSILTYGVRGTIENAQKMSPVAGNNGGVSTADNLETEDDSDKQDLRLNSSINKVCDDIGFTPSRSLVSALQKNNIHTLLDLFSRPLSVFDNLPNKTRNMVLDFVEAVKAEYEISSETLEDLRSKNGNDREEDGREQSPNAYGDMLYRDVAQQYLQSVSLSDSRESRVRMSLYYLGDCVVSELSTQDYNNLLDNAIMSSDGQKRSPATMRQIASAFRSVMKWAGYPISKSNTSKSISIDKVIFTDSENDTPAATDAPPSDKAYHERRKNLPEPIYMDGETLYRDAAQRYIKDVARSNQNKTCVRMGIFYKGDRKLSEITSEDYFSLVDNTAESADGKTRSLSTMRQIATAFCSVMRYVGHPLPCRDRRESRSQKDKATKEIDVACSSSVQELATKRHIPLPSGAANFLARSGVRTVQDLKNLSELEREALRKVGSDYFPIRQLIETADAVPS